MRKITHLLYAVFITLLFSSCGNDLIEDSLHASNEQINSLTFTYKGISYHSTYKNIGDSIVLDNQEANKLYQALYDKPQLATVVNTDGSLEFFDDSEALQPSLPITTRISVQGGYDQVGNSIGTLKLYEHIFDGRVYEFSVGSGGTLIPDFTNFKVMILGPTPTYENFNDKLSSLRFYSGGWGSCIITFYENINFGGKSLTLNHYGHRNPLEIASLRPFPFKKGKGSWNDETSSLKIRCTF